MLPVRQQELIAKIHAFVKAAVIACSFHASCRCETALNFFVHARQHGHLSHVKWFMFQDDDVYWRPRALIGILTHYTNNHLHEGPLAIAYETHWQSREAVAKAWTEAVHTRGFSDQHATKKTAALCNVDCVHRFPWYAHTLTRWGSFEVTPFSILFHFFLGRITMILLVGCIYFTLTDL